MKRLIAGIVLIAAGFLGGLLAQPQPFGGPGGFRVPPFAFGEVAQVQGNTIIVESRFGDRTFTRTVVVNNQTQVQRSQEGTKADIKANAYALVIGQPDPQSGWLRADTVIVMPNLPRQAGMAVGRIYDVRQQGNQFGINVPITVNPNAQIYKMVPIKVADIKQGERITVQGRNDEATGNLIAETILVGEMPRLGPGGFGGFGGPRGMGDRPRGFRNPDGGQSSSPRSN